MATSGTTAFNPPLGSLAAYALGRCDVRRTAILQEHLEDAYIAANLILQDWSNEQPQLFDLELLSFPLVQGQQTIMLPANVILVTDCYIQTPVANGITNNRVIYPIGRSEFSSYPNPLQQGWPSVYWFNRVVPPTLNLYLVPDGNLQYTLFAYALIQSQDAQLAGQVQMAIPSRWLKAYVDAMSRDLSLTYAPEKYAALEVVAGKSYDRARTQEREVVTIYVTPGLGSYYE
jgi:hypothetical protein